MGSRRRSRACRVRQATGERRIPRRATQRGARRDSSLAEGYLHPQGDRGSLRRLPGGVACPASASRPSARRRAGFWRRKDGVAVALPARVPGRASRAWQWRRAMRQRCSRQHRLGARVVAAMPPRRPGAFPVHAFPRAWVAHATAGVCRRPSQGFQLPDGARLPRPGQRHSHMQSGRGVATSSARFIRD